MTETTQSTAETLDDSQTCEEVGCDTAGTSCFYPDNETSEPNHWYCAAHAFKHGFCWGCGLFWGGCESFDFAPLHEGLEGLCENCRFAARDEFEREGEEYEDFEYADLGDIL